MPRLFLLRHAKAAWGAPGTADFDRPLAPEGMRAARTAGGFLASQGMAPALVLCSPALRTRQTWERAAEGAAAGAVRYPADLYDTDPATYLEVLRGAGAAESVLLVGHNPMMEEVALALAGTGEAKALEALRGGFPVCALAVLAFDAGFDTIAPGGGGLERFVVFEG